MRRVLILLAFATLGIMATATGAQAEVTINEKASLAFAGFVPCANSGVGEVVFGTIDVHNLVTSTINDNNVSWRFQFQPQGGSMVGAITGDTYRVAGVTKGTYSESLASDHYTLTYVNTFQLIGPGPNNNLLVHEIAHMTIDGNEDVIVRHDDLSIECN